jgi:hypothetical protein
MSNKGVAILVLCEDAAMGVFVRSALIALGYSKRSIRPLQIPRGIGDAKQFISQQLPQAYSGLQQYRQKNDSVKRALLVVSDADNETVDGRIRQLTSNCDPSPKAADGVAFLIPKWAIETWVQYLSQGCADETRRITPGDKAQFKKTSQYRVQGKKLGEYCGNRRPMTDAPPSLLKACEQFQSMRIG